MHQSLMTCMQCYLSIVLFNQNLRLCLYLLCEYARVLLTKKSRCPCKMRNAFVSLRLKNSCILLLLFSSLSPVLFLLSQFIRGTQMLYFAFYFLPFSFCFYYFGLSFTETNLWIRLLLPVHQNLRWTSLVTALSFPFR